MGEEAEHGEQEHFQQHPPQWSDPISEARQAELQRYLDRWQAELDHGARVGPFDTEPEELSLTGADVSWLAEQTWGIESGWASELHLERANLSRAHMGGADLRLAYLGQADLRGAHLGWSSLSEAHLERANLSGAQLQGAVLSRAHLEGANLSSAHLEGTDLSGAYLGTDPRSSTLAGLGADLHGAHLEQADLSRAHLERADLSGAQMRAADLGGAQLRGADLRETNLQDADLSSAYLEQANLSGAHLEEVDFSLAHLEGAILSDAQLRGADLRGAQLTRANLSWAQLDGANLSGAHLDGANLRGAQLSDANLRGAQLRGADLRETKLGRTDFSSAHLDGANLTAAWFDKVSRLNNLMLKGASLDQVTFDGTNLTVLDWGLVDVLGDEHTARTRKDKDGQPKNRATRVDEYRSAVRANRVLSVALQAQGLSEDASRFAYHAQVLQREVYRRQRKFGAYLFSLLIAALAGYGYRLWRILIVYGLSLTMFAAAYYAAGQWLGATHLTWYQAILVSLTAIHGRVFFESFGLNSIQSWVAAVESVEGIVIEGVFVAMLIQRFFGR